jgi:hypothetical protein
MSLEATRTRIMARTESSIERFEYHPELKFRQDELRPCREDFQKAGK